MSSSRLLLAVASVLAGTSVLLGVLGLVFNLVLLVLAAPFGAAAYFLWLGATGRIGGAPPSHDDRATRGPSRAGGQEPTSSGVPPGSAGSGAAGTSASTGRPAARHPTRYTRREASRILGVAPDADADTVRQAYRARVKEVHPDNGGDEAAFRRVNVAYERLRR